MFQQQKNNYTTGLVDHVKNSFKMFDVSFSSGVKWERLLHRETQPETSLQTFSLRLPEEPYWDGFLLVDDISTIVYS